VTNDAGAPYGDGPDPGLALPEIMQFKVSKPLQGKDTTANPANLVLPGYQRTVPNLSIPNLYKAGIPVRENVLKETTDAEDNPIYVRINGLWFGDPVEETPTQDSTEVWSFVNLTGDAHPMHTHLVMFQVLGRVPFNTAKYETDWLAWIAAGRNSKTKPKALDYATGGPKLPPPEEWGLKDTVKCYPGEIALVAGQFKVPPGSQKGGMMTMNGKMMFDPRMNAYEYVYHCHILEHEENDMMRPFVVKP
jgi:spore coat protein A